MLNLAFLKLFGGGEESTSLEVPLLQAILFRNGEPKPGEGGFPGGAVVESLSANAGDTGSSPGLGGSHMPRSN